MTIAFSRNIFFVFLFQACTGIEDVGEAIFILEENNWDLVVSVFHFRGTFVKRKRLNLVPINTGSSTFPSSFTIPKSFYNFNSQPSTNSKVNFNLFHRLAGPYPTVVRSFVFQIHDFSLHVTFLKFN